MNRTNKATEKLTPIESLQKTANKVQELYEVTEKELNEEHQFLISELKRIEEDLRKLIENNIGDYTKLPASIQGKDAVEIINKIYAKLI